MEIFERAWAWRFSGPEEPERVHLTMNPTFTNSVSVMKATSLCGLSLRGETLAAYETASGLAADTRPVNCEECRAVGQQLIDKLHDCIRGTR